MNPPPPTVSTSALVALVTLGYMVVATGYTELKDGRIPNWITVPGLLIGLAAGALEGGVTLSQSLYGILAGGGFLFIFYMFGGMGGGDVKLMAAVGALLGYPLILSVLMFTGLFGAALAIAMVIWNPATWRKLLRALRILPRPAPDDGERAADGGDAEPPRKATVPYGLAIIAGCLATVFLNA